MSLHFSFQLSVQKGMAGWGGGLLCLGKTTVLILTGEK